MTAEVNSQGTHLNSAGPSNWVVRHKGVILFAESQSRDAVLKLTSHLRGIDPKLSVRNATKLGYYVTRSYWVKAGYRGFEPEFQSEQPSFDDAADALRAWVQRQWTNDQDNHPTAAGREAARVRWHDVDALLHLASLSMIKNPSFRYDFGPLSPPEGKGHRLVIEIQPTPMSVLESLRRHSV